MARRYDIKDRIELLKPLFRGNENLQPGEIIEEERPRAEYLIKSGVAKLAPPAAPEPVQEPEKDPVLQELEDNGTEGAENAAKILANLKNAKK